MEILHWDLGLCTTGTSVVVELRGVEAFVRLLDVDNFQDYLDGDGFYAAESFVWQRSPVELEVPYDDHWYVAVDGHEGRIWVAVSTYDD